VSPSFPDAPRVSACLSVLRCLVLWMRHRLLFSSCAKALVGCLWHRFVRHVRACVSVFHYQDELPARLLPPKSAARRVGAVCRARRQKHIQAHFQSSAVGQGQETVRCFLWEKAESVCNRVCDDLCTRHCEPQCDRPWWSLVWQLLPRQRSRPRPVCRLSSPL
jgi:hypothetical protein